MDYNEMVSSADVVLVEFYTTWCRHCKTMAPIVESVKEKMSSRAVVYQFDGDQDPALVQRERIVGYPTFLLYKGGQQIWRHAGAVSESVLLSKVDEAAG